MEEIGVNANKVTLQTAFKRRTLYAIVQQADDAHVG